MKCIEHDTLIKEMFGLHKKISYALKYSLFER